MRNLGGKVFLTEDGFIGLFNFLKYKLVSLLHILKHLFLLPEIIFMVPEVKMTLIIFKSNALKLIRPEKKNVFNIHDPKGMKRLFQLRVGLSALRDHLKASQFYRYSE